MPWPRRCTRSVPRTSGAGSSPVAWPQTADAEYAKLVQRQESWGDYAQAFVRRRAAFTQAFGEAGERVNRDLVRSHATELLQR